MIGARRSIPLLLAIAAPLRPGGRTAAQARVLVDDAGDTPRPAVRAGRWLVLDDPALTRPTLRAVATRLRARPVRATPQEIAR